MPWNPALEALQTVLADLYPDDSDARRVVDQAGLPAANINFGGAALNDWHNILNEAEKRGKTGALIAAVQREYPDSAALKDAVNAYQTAPFPAVSLSGTQVSGRLLAVLGALAVVALAVVGVILVRGAATGSPATPTTAATSTVPAVATSTPLAAVATPAAEAPTATPSATPEFVARYSFSLDEEVEQTAYDVEPGLLPAATITDYLRLTKMTLGELVEPGASDLAFDVELTLKNTDTRPLVLDLSERFFSLEDDRGRTAGLVEFCCAASGKLLEPGAERVMRLVFRGVPGWFAKEGGVSVVFLNVRGLSPVRRAQWLIRLPVTGA